MRREPPAFALPLTIPELAKRIGVPRRTLFWRLMRLYNRDEVGERDRWLYRNPGGAWRVNVPRLRAAHPELFDAPSPDEVRGRLEAVEGTVRMLARRVQAQAASLREHRREHDGES